MLKNKFVQTKEAADAFGISSDVLKDRINEFKYGEHYIDIRGVGSVKPVYLWNVEAILAYWKTSPEYRGTSKTSRRTLKIAN